MKFWKLTFWMILACILSLTLCIACGDDDDDDDNENPSIDDDDDGDCTEEELCEFAIACGMGDYADVDECMADQAPDTCDMDAILACSCDCMDQYPSDCTKAEECGTACWTDNCQA